MSPEAKERRRNLRLELIRNAMKERAKARKEMGLPKIEYPPYMDDEGDPTWEQDGPEEGWGEGFDSTQFFMRKKGEKKKSERKTKTKPVSGSESESSDTEIEDEEWALEDEFQWMVWEMSQEEWQETIWEDKRPILVFIFHRFGPRARACWDTLKELEKAVKTFYEMKKIALRAAKIDQQRDQDMVAALKVESVPALLIIRESKLLHRIYGTLTQEQILQATAHFFHGARRPAFLGPGLTTAEHAPVFHPKPKEKEVDSQSESETSEEDESPTN